MSIPAKKNMPAQVWQPIVQLLDWLAWLVLLVCIARTTYLAGLLAMRIYREEAIEGIAGSLLAAVLVGAAGGLAIALVPNH